MANDDELKYDSGFWRKPGKLVEKALHFRFPFFTSIADVKLHLNQYRFYQFLGMNGAFEGMQGAGNLKDVLEDLGFATMPPDILRFVVKNVESRGVAMAKVEANFLPIWPGSKTRPAAANNPNHVGCLFYGLDKNWYLAINQLHFGKFMLGPEYPDVTWAMIDPTDPKAEAYITARRNSTGVFRGKNIYESMIKLLPTLDHHNRDDDDYVHPLLENYRGGATFRPMSRQKFNDVTASYFEVMWKMKADPVHKISVLDPKQGIVESKANVKPTAITEARLMVGDSPLLLPSPKR